MMHKCLIVLFCFQITAVRAEDAVDPRIVEKLTEIVKIFETQFERERMLSMADGLTGTELGKLRLLVCNAKIDLARETGDKSEIVAQLREILKIYQNQMNEAQLRFELGRSDANELANIKAKMLQTEIRILRLEKE